MSNRRRARLFVVAICSGAGLKASGLVTGSRSANNTGAELECESTCPISGNYFVGCSGAACIAGAGTAIDAVTRMRQAGVTTTLLSFDLPVVLLNDEPVADLFAEDEDVVAWDGAGWTMFFDGSGNGVPAELDVDAFDRDSENGTRYFSFDTSGRIEADDVDFDDEDVVAFDGTSWSLAYDASTALDASFAAGDLDALGARTRNLFSETSRPTTSSSGAARTRPDQCTPRGSGPSLAGMAPWLSS
jgi:hypothetical protein